MSVTKEEVLAALDTVTLPGGKSLVAADMIRALRIENDVVHFVIEAPTPEDAAKLGGASTAAKATVSQIAGVKDVSVVLTAHGPAKPAAAASEPPSLKVGRHPTPQAGPMPVAGVDRIIAIGSGKGGGGEIHSLIKPRSGTGARGAAGWFA